MAEGVGLLNQSTFLGTMGSNPISSGKECLYSSGGEHFHGKEKVSGSIPDGGLPAGKFYDFRFLVCIEKHIYLVIQSLWLKID